MRKTTIVLSVLAALAFAATSSAFAKETSASKEMRALPSLATVVEVYGKRTSSPEFLGLARQCGLRLYFRKEELKLTGGNLIHPNRHPLTTLGKYGGSGVVLVASSTVVSEGDLSGVTPRDEPVVVGILIIVGECDEQEMFGVWKGEMPKIELPLTPESLLARYRYPDSDHSEVTYAMGGASVLEQRRRINYYIPALGSNFPYAFNFRNEKLALIEVWPTSAQYKTIRPQTPK